MSHMCLLLISALLCIGVINGQLENLKAEHVVQLTREEKFVVVLFSVNEKCVANCAKMESSLVSIREDLVESLNAWVVKCFDKALAGQYGVIESGIVFVRNGIPMLYFGRSDDDEELHSFIVTNTVSSLHLLDDSSFEHQTQAATGATTGDWLVIFARADCHECATLRASLEALAAALKGAKNVAIVSRDENGDATARRFGAKIFPSAMLFRLGHLYRYNMKSLGFGELKAFVDVGFRNVKAESVPVPKSPFDDMTEKIADWLLENPTMVWAILIGIVLIMLLCWSCMKTTSATTAKKKKK